MVVAGLSHRHRPARDLPALAARLGIVLVGGPAGATAGLVLQGPSGVILAATPAAGRILGLGRDALLGRTSQDPRWQAVDEQLRPLAAGDHPAMVALRTGVPVRDAVMGVHRPRTDDAGRHVWLGVTAVPVPAGEGGGVLSVVSVLTGRRAVELELADSEAILRLVTESATDVLAWLDAELHFLWVSPSSRQVLGRTPGELVGTSALLLVDPDDVAQARSAEVVPPGGVWSVTTRVRHPESDDVWIETTGRRSPPGSSRAGEVFTSSRDVTARVLAQQARAGAEAERDRATRLFAAAMEHAPTGVVVQQVDGVVVAVNRALAEVLGRSADELVGGCGLPADGRGGSLLTGDQLRTVLTGEVPSLEGEHRVLRGDNCTAWLSTTTVVLRSGTGEPEHLLTQVQDVTARRHANDQLTRMAVTDALTGLPNRVVLMDRLGHALAGARRDGTGVGVVFVDLDHFKAVNDTFGHDVGDEVLRVVASRIAGAVREGDTAVRLGGDEFVVLVEQVADIAPVSATAARILALLAEPVPAQGVDVPVSASVGITLEVGTTAREAGTSAREALSHADVAMYRAKQAGRGRVDVYGEAAEVAAVERAALQEQLRRGLARDELRVLYQPVVALPGGDVVGREALVRWAHPQRGLLEPGAFLPGAEQSRLVVDVGEWVLRRACADAAAWPDGAVVHVNTSARQLAQPGFADLVHRVLTGTGLPPGRLCLEITERLIHTSSPSTLAATAELTRTGVALALDDFGTGQSSISALLRLPLAVLKIDQAFVAGLPTDPTAVALVDGLLHLGRAMGLDVVAEGVETPEQAAWLAAHGCSRAQGYLFGRPTDVAPPGPDVAPPG